MTAVSTAPQAATRALTTLPEVRARGRVRGALALLGPAFVAAVAYVDPGNFATNFAAGAGTGYQLVWVVVLASLMAGVIQYLASKAGLATGRSLPELCRQRYGARVNLLLWLQAEAVAMATDLAEFAGAAIGLNLVFGVALLPAGLITAVVAFALLALQQRGYRRFELAVIALLALVGLGFLYLLLAAGRPDYHAAAAGLVPHLGGGTLTLTAGIIGATVMPHVVYLHSALHQDRVTATTGPDRRVLLRWNRRDCVAGLGLAGLINLAMLAVAAALFSGQRLAGGGGLGAAYDRIGSVAGGGAALAFGVALMASGLSSSSVGTYAGQVVMSGFMNWHIPVLARRALTMAPALLVLAFAANPSQALVYSQVALSFGIPFAIIPLLLVTGDRATMTDLVNRRLTSGLMLVITAVIVGLNLYLLGTALVSALR